MSQLPAVSLITELEVRQDEALQSLAELEERITLALAQFGGVVPTSAKVAKGNGRANEQLDQESVELKIHHPEEMQAREDDTAAA
jgi:hypothetical protein